MLLRANGLDCSIQLFNFASHITQILLFLHMMETLMELVTIKLNHWNVCDKEGQSTFFI